MASYKEELRKALRPRAGDEKAYQIAYRMPALKAQQLLKRLKDAGK